MTLETIHPEGWKAAKGYANGIVATGNKTLYVGGQIGWNADQEFETDDFIGQFEQTLRNILDVVVTAGGKAEHIARLTWYITDRAEYLKRQKECGEAYRRVMGRHFPAMAVVEVSSLMEARAKVEIEATAVLPN